MFYDNGSQSLAGNWWTYFKLPFLWDSSVNKTLFCSFFYILLLLCVLYLLSPSSISSILTSACLLHTISKCFFKITNLLSFILTSKLPSGISLLSLPLYSPPYSPPLPYPFYPIPSLFFSTILTPLFQLSFSCAIEKSCPFYRVLLRLCSNGH